MSANNSGWRIPSSWKVATVTIAVVLLCGLPSLASGAGTAHFKTKSGLYPWVDVYSPKDKHTITSSRGQTWELTMSDEFNVPGRDFSAGKDHLWTAVDLPDGVNTALEYYSINMTSTKNESDGRGIFQIEVREDNITFRVYNAYRRPPQFETHSMYYRAGMVQSWNKFCFQGGRMEVLAQMPGAVGPNARNPDVTGDINQRVKNIEYYPTWPGIWTLGNLGRALFTGSTNRMWPWSYDGCNDDLRQSQRISGCDENPGFGLHPRQGRGAPEIDLVEGGGLDISTSIQLAPGMAKKFRKIPPQGNDQFFCVYSKDCKTPGANFPGIPRAIYEERPYKTWYQGLRYAPNTHCTPISSMIQDPDVVIRNVRRGITSNTCNGTNTCPGSFDGYSDLSLIDGVGPRHWGVNEVGGCMPYINGYTGTFLCDPDNTHEDCIEPRKPGNPKTRVLEPFNYQMDALSANWGIPMKAYKDYLKYEFEWVTGRNGYVRWYIEGDPVYEITSESVENIPQDSQKSNPEKIMIEEPLYVILNVALSTSWGAKPPNPGKPCRGDGKDPKVNRICDEFPMYMKIDYIRIYQDTSEDSTMTADCDPATHPTKEWIEGHIDEYQDARNRVIEVIGGAPCFSDDDCTVGTVSYAKINTGVCRQARCECTSPAAWRGPRCTMALKSSKGFGPPLEVAISYAGVAGLVTIIVFFKFLQAKSRVAVSSVGFTKGIEDDSPMEDVASSNLSMSKDDKMV